MKPMMIISALAAALTVGGCASMEDTAGTAVVTDSVTGGSVLYEGNTRLKHDVSVTKVTYDTTPTGMNRVNVEISSKVHREQHLQYRIAWYNSEGMEIDAESRSYRTLVLQGLDQVVVTGVANSPAAVKSRIRIRETK